MADEAYGPWLAEYSRRCAQTFDDSVRAGSAAAERWARRSLEDRDWSPDAMTADVIGAWEELTPLAGRWLDLWLEAAQEPLRGPAEPTHTEPTHTEPTHTEPTHTAEPGVVGGPERVSLVSRRAEEYRDLWAGAAEKFRASSYRSEDLVEDLLTSSAKVTRDLSAGAALFWSRWASGIKPD